MVVPEPVENILNQPRALRHCGAAIPGGFKLPLDARRFVAKGTPELADQ
jgi:hypothetical protein